MASTSACGDRIHPLKHPPQTSNQLTGFQIAPGHTSRLQQLVQILATYNYDNTKTYLPQTSANISPSTGTITAIAETR